MSSSRPSHPYRDPLEIIKRAQRRPVLERDALRGAFRDLNELAAGLDAVLRYAPRATLHQLAVELRTIRLRYVEARHAVTIWRGLGTVLGAGGIGGTVLGALLHQALWWLYLPLFGIALAGLALVARAVLRIDEVVAAVDRLLARVERVVDSDRVDDPLAVVAAEVADEAAGLRQLRAQAEREHGETREMRERVAAVERRFEEAAARMDAAHDELRQLSARVRVEVAPDATASGNVVESAEDPLNVPPRRRES
jgi:hypothetical protein